MQHYRRNFILFTLLFICLSTSIHAQIPGWQSISRKLENTQTDKGREEVAREVGFAWMSENLNLLGLNTQGLEYLVKASADSSLGKFNNALGKFGGVMIMLQFADDVRNQRPAKEMAYNLVKGSAFFAATISQLPWLNGFFYAGQLVEYLGKQAVAAVYTGDDKIWWTLYEDYFLNDDGKKTPGEWVELFKDKNLNAYNAHMDEFFTETGKEFAEHRRQAYSKNGMNLPKVADPGKSAVIKHKEAFRLRFFRNHLEKKLGEWAYQEVQKQLELERQKLKKELAEMVKKSAIRLMVTNADDGLPVHRAFAKISWKEEGRSNERMNRSGSDGLIDLNAVPPWADGPMTIEADGYKTLVIDDFSRMFSTIEDPRENRVAISAYSGHAKVLILDERTGKPVSGAAISATFSIMGSEKKGQTGADGVALISLSRPGNWTFSINADGYSIQKGDRFVSFTQSGQTSEVVFRMSPMGGVSINALARDSKTGKPIAGAKVVFKSNRGSESGVTGSDGRLMLSLREVKEDSINVTFSHEGYKPKTISARIEKGTAAATADLEPAEAALTVSVKGGEKKLPVSGAKIVVTPGNHTGTTGGDGCAEIVIGPEETVEVSCKASGFPAARAKVRIENGVGKVDFILAAETALLSIKVGNKANNQPLSGVKVRAVVGNAEITGETDESGNCSLEIPAGDSVKVYLFKDGFKKVEVSKKIVAGKASVGGTLAPELAILAITLKDRATGKPVVGAAVNGGGRSTSSGKDGIAYLEVEPTKEVLISASFKGYKDRQDKGTAPNAGEIKKIGWYLDPAAEQPKPAASSASAAGGGNTPFCGTYHGKFVWDPDVDSNKSAFKGQKRWQGGVDTESNFTLEVIRLIVRSNPKSKDYPWDGIYAVRVSFYGEYPNSYAKNGFPFSGEGEWETEIGGNGVNESELSFSMNQKKLSTFIYKGKAGEGSVNCSYSQKEGLIANLWYSTSDAAGAMRIHGK
ncbi:MAG: carboxypeptidase regulatory-like domain-containing protein [Candidatus Riflebacteria bacterium]